ncbi:MAG: DUF4832 domain-containing protein [Thermogutta sp.]
MVKVLKVFFFVAISSAGLSVQAEEAYRPLAYTPAPVDNPLKGLVPYQGDVRDRFPHSMEFKYISYSALVKGYEEFDWQPLEQLLEDVKSRGHQTVFRVYLEFPKRTGVIPDFLLRDGLAVRAYVNTNTQPFPPAPVTTPDYENEKLRRSLKNFIAALGRKYDGDPRIGFITAGLLGTWGEWHTHPKPELFASKIVQREVMDAYEAAFKVTPILLRYPAGDQDPRYAENASRPFGYHDDSFAWATLHTGRRGDEWFFMTRMKAAGPLAENKWKTHPIGGEIRPEAWGQVFDDPPADSRVQDFRRCVEATHVTWLMDSGMFQKNQSPDRIARAIKLVQRMGYEFHALAVMISEVRDGKFSVNLKIENRGIAPFYYDWKPEYGLLQHGKVIKTFPGSGTLKGLPPGEKPAVWSDTFDVRDVLPGKYTVFLRIPNPMPGGKPIRFANATQDIESGRLLLGDVRVP